MFICPKCHAILSEAVYVCRCGLNIMKNSLVLLSPLPDAAKTRIEHHVNFLALKIVRGMEIPYSTCERYVGDVKAGKRHGIGELYLLDGSSNEGVWIEDVYSKKLSNLRNNISLTQRKLSREFWDAFNLTSLTQRDKETISKKIYDEMSFLVGNEISIGLTDEQLQGLDDADDDEEVAWLNLYCPDYKEIVDEIERNFLDTIIRDHVHGPGFYLSPESDNSSFEDEDDGGDVVDWTTIRRNAKRGYAPAQKALGALYLGGEKKLHTEPDSSKAAMWLQMAAEQGDPESQYLLGTMFFCGNGVAYSPQEAIKWYQLAASQGFAAAQFILGSLFQKGDGVPQSNECALRWHRLAAEQGYADAQNSLGKMYEYGNCLTENLQKAMHWYRLAANQGHIEAQYNLGRVYMGKDGFSIDDSAAAKWIHMAAEQGHGPSCFILGYLYERGRGVERNSKEGIRWYHKGADYGDIDSMYMLGCKYEIGLVVAQNAPTAAQWFLKAAQLGHAPAQCEIGYMYREGIGVEANPAMAEKWFRKSAEQGNEQAKKHLKDMQNDGTIPL